MRSRHTWPDTKNKLKGEKTAGGPARSSMEVTTKRTPNGYRSGNGRQEKVKK